MKKILLLLIVLLSISISVNAWYFTNEPYRIPIKITSPSNLTDYQVLIDLNNTSLTGDTNNHFWLNTRTDGLDIRFSNKDDNQALDFFRETFTDNGRAKFWVELKNISSGDQNIYLYYGSNASDDNSSWENTFIDDGNGNNMLGWSLSKDAGSDWYSTGTQYQNDSATGTQHMSRSRTFSNALAYAVSVELQSTAVSNETNYFLFDEANFNTPYVSYNTNSGGKIKFYASGNDGPASCDISVSTGTLYDVNITRDYSGRWTMYANNTSCEVDNTTDVNGTDHGFSHASPTTGRADAVWLKNTNAGGEPTYSVQNFQDDENLTLRIVDEETQAPIQPTLTINGVSVDVNALGYFDIDTAILSFPITIEASLTGYDTRTFTYETAQALTNSSIIGLRTDTEANDIDFVFYGPDEVTTLPLYYIEVVRDGVTSARGKTGSNAQISFNLAPQDSQYDIKVYSLGSDTNLLYTYSTVAVTIARPKNEITNASISPNSFNLDIGGLGLQNYTAQTLPISTVVIIGNTEDAYTLRIVDNNADGQQYYSRSYLMQVKGDVSTLTVQPYLIPIADGILVNLKVADIVSNLTVPNIRIQLKAGVSGTSTVLEDQLTNTAGIAQMVMLAQKNYEIIVSSPNQDINYFPAGQTISASSQAFTIWINYTTRNNTVTSTNTDVNFLPSDNIISVLSQKFDINVSSNATFDNIFLEIVDTNKVIDSSSCSTSPCNDSFTINMATIDSNVIYARAVIQRGDTNYYFNRTFFVAPYQSEIFNRIGGLKDILSPTSLALIMFLVVFGVIGFLGSSVIGNNISQVFIVVILFGVFYLMWFTENLTLMVGFFGALLGVLLLYLWSRKQGGV